MSAAFQLPELERPPLTPLSAMRVATPPPPPIDVEAEVAAARAAGYAEGHAEGLAQGLAEGRAQLASAIAALESAALQMSQERDALCARVEPSAVQLALAGAEQIVGAALELDPSLLKNTVLSALRRSVERDHVTIFVNPDDLDLIRSFAGDLVDQLGGIESLEVQAERRLQPGGVIVSTPTGDVDARLETRLDQLGLIVREALAR